MSDLQERYKRLTERKNDLVPRAAAAKERHSANMQAFEKAKEAIRAAGYDPATVKGELTAMRQKVSDAMDEAESQMGQAEATLIEIEKATTRA